MYENSLVYNRAKHETSKTKRHLRGIFHTSKFIRCVSGASIVINEPWLNSNTDRSGRDQWYIAVGPIHFFLIQNFPEKLGMNIAASWLWKNVLEFFRDNKSMRTLFAKNQWSALCFNAISMQNAKDKRPRLIAFDGKRPQSTIQL